MWDGVPLSGILTGIAHNKCEVLQSGDGDLGLKDSRLMLHVVDNAIRFKVQTNQVKLEEAI